MPIWKVRVWIRSGGGGGITSAKGALRSIEANIDAPTSIDAREVAARIYNVTYRDVDTIGQKERVSDDSSDKEVSNLAAIIGFYFGNWVRKQTGKMRKKIFNKRE